jgi:dTDP-4-amino-4,6-dideoxygalactose transaminase
MSAIPRRPVLDWSWFGSSEESPLPSVGDLPHQQLLTSGRAALYQALQQLPPSPRQRVLVPSFHCPTMVSPIVQAGLQPEFYALAANGLPDTERLNPNALAVIAFHPFGLTQSMAVLRAWCDRHGVALIEDCAHALFGHAGERPVGTWGDYATASLTKFLPVPEAGLLASNRHPLRPIALQAPSLAAQLRGWVDVLETAAASERLPGINALVGVRARLRKQPMAAALPASQQPELTVAQALQHTDMGRHSHQAVQAARWLARLRPRARDVALRKENFNSHANAFGALPGAGQPPGLPLQGDAPYAFPLWIANPDRAEAAYQQARRHGLPVFRWDRIWPGAGALKDDAGEPWRNQVLQLLCHASLHPKDLALTQKVLVDALQ